MPNINQNAVAVDTCGHASVNNKKYKSKLGQVRFNITIWANNRDKWDGHRQQDLLIGCHKRISGKYIGCWMSVKQVAIILYSRHISSKQVIGCSDCWGWFNFLHRLDFIFELVYFRNQKMVNLQYRIFTSEIDITSVAAGCGPTKMFIL